MTTKEDLLARVNRDIPKGVDWKRGAERYVASCFEKQGRVPIERYSMSKPLCMVGLDDPVPAINETVHYLNNFTNALGLLNARHGARVLDVACGGGWVSHYLSKMGYWTYGIDISADFIDLARIRLASDATIDVSVEEATKRFAVLDIETTSLPPEIDGTFDIVWLESCLHHFVDPVAALQNLASALKPDGVIVLIEFENRKGAIKQEYMDVMREYDTLERPYARAELVTALELAGLSEVEFVGTINGWISPDDPSAGLLGERLIQGANDTNLALCAKQPGRLNTMFPHRKVIHAIALGQGFHAAENGFRWCSPTAEFVVKQALPSLSLALHSHLPRSNGRDQEVVAYGANGEIARLTMSKKKPSGEMQLGPLTVGERVTLHSAEAFRPSWTGSDDQRLLSFYVENGPLES